MAEYKVSFKATVYGAFLGIFPQVFTDIQIFEAETGQDAMDKARAEVKSQLRKRGLDPEFDGFKVEITDIRRL